MRDEVAELYLVANGLEAAAWELPRGHPVFTLPVDDVSAIVQNE